MGMDADREPVRERAGVATVKSFATIRLLTGEETHLVDGPPTKRGDLPREWLDLCEPCKRKTTAKALHASD